MVPPTLVCAACGITNQPQAAFCSACGHPLQSTGTPPSDAATGRLLSHHLLKERYRILDIIGKGGMGAVYIAEDIQLGNRKVAIKEMSQRGFSPQEIIAAADTFKQEAHILAGLQHPNLPGIHDHFAEGGRWYLVMSFIQGETLAKYLKCTNGRKLPPEEVVQLGIQLCTVLAYLHSQQPPIIFRDLKPSNIMRTQDGHIYLIDFGIARHFKPGQTRDTAAYGSMGFAAPEQYGTAQTTPQSDIYSLGVVLYHLVSGYDPSLTPFRFPPLASLAPTAPPRLLTLITRMIELDEDKRPGSMLAVKQELQSIASSSSEPTRSMITPSIPAVPTPASKQMKVFSVGGRQLICTMMGIILSIAALLLNQNLNVQEPIYSLINGSGMAALLFLAAISGPWGGLGAVGIGSIAAFAATGVLSGSWRISLLLALLGFIVGLTLLQSQGRYNNVRSILFTTAVSWLAFMVYIVSFDAANTPIYGMDLDLVSIFKNDVVTSYPIIILLPVLLIIYSSVTGDKKQS